ncbi:sigma-70 family RNA polymerase sigma factor [Paraherbaspirillum soli]|uniref:Sigma-70 family RNA polymerase sigma factor n=1 Tax=Paraherbaspirillum soli TaxID=631222 RepID=A0ABW0M7M0_9BURK
MDQQKILALLFEEHRSHLRKVAYRMLGSLSEAEDAVQETWIRLSRADISAVANLPGWLTTVVSHICLDMLRTRNVQREEPLEEHEPAEDSETAINPEEEALLAESVGLALLVVLDTLTPAERLAFVLHDMFDLSFEEIAPIVERTPTATRQLASRARRRVQGGATLQSAALIGKRKVVEAFLAASRAGDMQALLAVLAPDVVLQADGAPMPVRGAAAVVQRALSYAARSPFTRLALVNGSPALVVAPLGRLMAALCFTVADGKITGVEVATDAARLHGLRLGVLGD